MGPGGRGDGARRSRSVRAFFRLPGSRLLIVVTGALAVLLVLSVFVLRARYTAPDGTTGLGLFPALYLALSLLALGPTEDLPVDGASRAVYVVLPVVALAVLGQLAVRLVVTLTDRQRWEAAVASTYSDHVIVCGLGRVGFRVVRWLLDLGEDVVVVDLPDDAEHLHDQVRAWGVPIIGADARRTEVLEQAGVQVCSAVVPVTDDDLVNLSIATAARSARPGCRIVLRTFEDRLAANLQKGFDIHRAYSTSALAAPAFACAAVHAPVDYALAYGEDGAAQTLVTITKFTVVEGSSLAGWSLRRLEEVLEVRVLAHRRHGFEQNPPLDRRLEVGDGVVLAASPERLDRVARHTPPTRELARWRDGRWPIEPWPGDGDADADADADAD